MRKLFVLALFLVSVCINAQQSPALIDSFKLKLTRAKTSEEKVTILGNLAMTLMNTNMPEADKYGVLLTREAEMSRDRVLMVKALLLNGQRYSFFGQNKAFLTKSIDYYNKGLALARESKLEKQVVEALLLLSYIHFNVPDLDKSLSYTSQAFAIASTLKLDSLSGEVHNSYGNIYQRKKESILALRNFLTALRIGEEIKNSGLLRNCYTYLSNFYRGIKEYDRAIDFSKKSMDELEFTDVENKSYLRAIDLYSIGNLYMAKKDFEMSQHYYELSIALADSVKFEPLKMPAYNGLLNQFLQAKQPQKALEFFNNRPDLKQYITNFGFGHVIDMAYGVIYSELKKFDSAQYFFRKAEPGFESTGTPASRLEFYVQYADFLNGSGNSTASIAYFTKAQSIADATGNLTWQQLISQELDSIYFTAGDYKQSHFYNGLYHQYKDSLQKLGEEKDLLQMELADEQQRQLRIEKEAAEKLTRKHNVQYMGITIGIAIVFLLLVLMGIFKVSETTIKVLGFFAFIFLFEFIILLADAKIHHWTHGEPLPLLGIKIILIAMLLPLHHWLEHKVVHYLASKRLIVPSGKNLLRRLFAKLKSVTKHSGYPDAN